ncbi:MAG: hypothetical protein ACRDTF_15315 [Pseudonocardiaceae bacterium]
MTRHLITTLAAAALTLAGCAGSTTTTPTTTPRLPAASQSSSPVPAAPTQVVLPEVAGRNGKIVLDELEKLGLTNVDTASADENDTVVLLPANWTAVEIEPAAGTTVYSDDTVVVTLTKKK